MRPADTDVLVTVAFNTLGASLNDSLGNCVYPPDEHRGRRTIEIDFINKNDATAAARVLAIRKVTSTTNVQCQVRLAGDTPLYR